MRQIAAGSMQPDHALPRRCPGTIHDLARRRHCSGKHCLERREDLLVLWWAPASLIDVPDVLCAFDGLRELSDGHVLPLVVHFQHVAGYVAEARGALLHYSLSSRVAMVGASPVDRVIAAFFETGHTETRYFENVMTAEAWARDC